MKISRSVLILLVSTILSCTAAVGAEEVGKMTTEFSAILRQGDVRELRRALDEGAPVNGRDSHGNTPLIQATLYGDPACMRLLLERGAEANVANTAGATALMRAAGDLEKVKLLVARGADVNARSGLGNTALMLAARNRNGHSTVEFLMAHGASATVTNEFGGDALMAAAASGDVATARLLIKNGANVNGQPAQSEPGFLFGGGRTALAWASYRGDLAMMKVLIGAGADVNAECMLGTPLSSAAWGDRTEAAQLLIERGAQVNHAGMRHEFTALHWAASSEEGNVDLMKLLLKHGANPNASGGDQVDAFMDVSQTPLMLARRRGETAAVAALLAAGATNGTPDRARSLTPPIRTLGEKIDAVPVRAAIAQAVPLLQYTAIESKKEFVSHVSRQDCVSCHQQMLPMAAIGMAKKQAVPIDVEAERELIKMVGAGELKNVEPDWQPLFHPDPVGTKGYALLAYAAEDLPADEYTDSAVHHLAAIQGKEGQWYNNLPRPPIQTGDIGATALAVHALQRYPIPSRKAEFANRVEQARRWLWAAKAQNNEGQIYQILGLAWGGESSRKLQPFAKTLVAAQRTDGGWAQLPGMRSDAYATAQALYALRVGAGLKRSDPAIERGYRFLLTTQLEDGTWHVARRAFPFQPTMKSGFPHGRDSWISAAATSWAVMALSLEDTSPSIALKK
jgi:ankyrin repeat protein